jgi:hypothetical protein
MEDSLYGFRFKSQTSLLVSGPHEVDEVLIESMQWQDCLQHEVWLCKHITNSQLSR